MNGEAKETSLAAVLGRCPGSRSPTLSVRLAWSDDTHHQGSPTNHLTLSLCSPSSLLPVWPLPGWNVLINRHEGLIT